MHPDLESNQLIDAYRESVHIFRLPDTEHIRDVDRFIAMCFIRTHQKMKFHYYMNDCIITSKDGQHSHVYKFQDTWKCQL